MKKAGSCYMFIAITFLFTINSFWLPWIPAEHSYPVEPNEQEEIINIIATYFETRYLSHITLKLPNIEEFFDDSPQAMSFLFSELEKLEIELYHASVKGLRYEKANFFLKFTDISFNQESQVVTASLIEGHDVVFEGSSPLVSTMRNLQHYFILRKESDTWKIVSDEYEDYLWRMIRTTKTTKNELLEAIDSSLNRTYDSQGTQIDTYLCSLPTDSSSHPYNRNGAIEYAHQWATAPRPYNPKYHDFTDDGGDCTNFVNQAIHERSNAEMVFGGIQGQGSLGWYFYNVSNYSSSWTDVQSLYDFITQYWVWPRPGYDNPEGPGGPEGCEVVDYQAYEGDLVQFEWTGNPGWDHSVIIVRSEDYGYHIREHWVAGHSDDVDDYPLAYFDYADIRFIHIDRIDGYAKVYLPLVMKYVHAGTGGASEPEIPFQNPYPEP